MQLDIGVIQSENSMNIYSINTENNEFQTKRLETQNIKDQKLDLLLFDENDQLDQLSSMIEKENQFYPISTLTALNLNKDSFGMLEGAELVSLHAKSLNRWLLNNNIQTIEQIYTSITYLKDLWIKDRNSFFEELWFLIKRNIAANDLTIIFHDLKELSKKQEEKGEKPSLCYSKVTGTKIPNLKVGKEAEAHLMSEYEKEFNDFFNITEFSKEKSQFVACAKIGLSPILIMAKISQLNQLQQSILVALFSGLQVE